MNSLQPHGIQKSRSVSNDQSSIKVVLRLRPVTTFGNRLRAVSVKAPPLEQAANKGMRFELLKAVMRIDARIRIIEADNKPDGNSTILHVVNEATAKLF